MGAGCCIRLDPTNNNIQLQQLKLQNEKKEQRLRDLVLYYKANKSFMHQKIRIIYKQILKTEHFESSILNLNFVNMSASKADSLLQIIPFLENLTVLKLWKAGLGSEGMQKISKELGTLYKLEVLSLEDNSIFAQGATFLASGIRKLLHIRELWLHINDIGVAGAESLSYALQGFHELERLGLDENAMENKGAVRIIEAIKGHMNMKTIGLGYNSLWPGTCLWIAKEISHIALEKVVLSGNDVNSEIEAEIKSILPATQIIV
jgi:Ran GTPase-activating protein (RanGAP) involved in mRNA processing and transport